MPWLFETICPKCLKANRRYWQTVPVHDHPIPDCLGVTCECLFEYIAINDQLKCLSCSECAWKLRGYRIMVINTYEVVDNWVSK
jgi:hypothetical protein